VVAKGDISSSARFVISLEPPDAQVLFVGWIEPTRRDGIFYTFSAGEFPLGVWHHVAVVQELIGGYVQVSLFIDGNQSGVAPMAPNTFPQVGMSADFRFCSLDGDIDDVRLWSVARARGDIVANMRRSLSPGDPGIAAYYSLDESGQQVRDGSGGGLNGVLGDTFAAEATDPTRISDNAF
jgi:hypothetical protein